MSFLPKFFVFFRLAHQTGQSAWRTLSLDMGQATWECVRFHIEKAIGIHAPLSSRGLRPRDHIRAFVAHTDPLEEFVMPEKNFIRSGLSLVVKRVPNMDGRLPYVPDACVAGTKRARDNDGNAGKGQVQKRLREAPEQRQSTLHHSIMQESVPCERYVCRTCHAVGKHYTLACTAPRPRPQQLTFGQVMAMENRPFKRTASGLIRNEVRDALPDDPWSAVLRTINDRYVVRLAR